MIWQAEVGVVAVLGSDALKERMVGLSYKLAVRVARRWGIVIKRNWVNWRVRSSWLPASNQ